MQGRGRCAKRDVGQEGCGAGLWWGIWGLGSCRSVEGALFRRMGRGKGSQASAVFTSEVDFQCPDRLEALFQAERLRAPIFLSLTLGWKVPNQPSSRSVGPKVRVLFPVCN